MRFAKGSYYAASAPSEDLSRHHGRLKVARENYHSANSFTLGIDAERIVSSGKPINFVLPMNLHMRDRPDKLDEDGFAMFMGRYD